MTKLWYALWKNEKFSLTGKINRQINSLVFWSIKTLFSRNFCQKSVRLNFRNFHTVCVEKREILSHWKKFRQINYLVISLLKPLFSRNFCEKCVRENFCNFHSVGPTLWKLRKFTLTKFWQKFRESNGFTKEITK